MRIKRILATIATIALGSLAAQQSSAQDLLARQAPIDRKMKAVDTLVLQSILDRENGMIPSSDLYAEWENSKVHNRQASIPDNFTIDLREFSMPTVSRVVTSNYGPRWGRTHEGLDIKVYTGDTIRAAFPGKVRIVKYDRGYGRYIVIRHENGLETVYGHLSRFLVQPNQYVKAGQPIALSGSTGRSTGPHLHFETRFMGYAINPEAIFDFENRVAHTDSYTFHKSTYTRSRNFAPARASFAGAKSSAKSRTLASTKRHGHKAARTTHVVRSGESLSKIAARNGTTVAKLKKMNRVSGNTVKKGQVLRVK